MPYQPRLMHDVLDSLDVAVVVIDEESRVLAGNVAATRLLGIRRGRRSGDAPYTSVVQVVDEDDHPVDVVSFARWRRHATHGDTVLVRVTREDAGERWLSATAQTVADDIDGVEAVVCRYADVTAERDLERRAAIALDHAARTEIDLVAAEQRVALLEELLMQLATGPAVAGG